MTRSRRADVSARRRRDAGNPGGVGPSLPQHERDRPAPPPARPASRSATRRHGRGRPTRRPRAPRPARAGRAAGTTRPRGRVREGLREGHARPVERLLLGASPDDPRVRRRPRLEERRTSGARLRAARTRAPATRAPAESPGRRRPSRHRRSGLRTPRQTDRAQRVLEQDRAGCGRSSAVRPGVSTSARARSSSGRRRRCGDAAPSPSLTVATPSYVLQPLVHDLRSAALIGSSATRSPSRNASAARARQAPRASRGGGRDSRRHRRRSPCVPRPAVQIAPTSILQRIDRLAVPADQQAKVAAGARASGSSPTRRPRRPSTSAAVTCSRARGRAARSLSSGRGGRRSSAGPARAMRAPWPACSPLRATPARPRPEPGKRTRGLVERRVQPLELAQRLPLRLADVSPVASTVSRRSPA